MFTFFSVNKNSSIIFLTLVDIFCENFLPTLEVSLDIASLDTKLRPNVSLSASEKTFLIDDTYNAFSPVKSNIALFSEFDAIFILTLSPPFSGRP